MKRYLCLVTLLGSFPLFAPAALAQWIESPSVAKPDQKVEFLQFSGLTTTSSEADALGLTAGEDWVVEEWDDTDSTQMAQTFNRNLFVNEPWSYIGVGFNIGMDGVTQLGESSVVINSKIALSSSLSLRPAAWIGDKVAFGLPLSYDIHLTGSDPFAPAKFHPFIGGGVMFTTDEDTSATDNAEDNFGPLLMGGVDIRLSDDWVFNTSANVGFLDDRTEVGIVLGVGYVFPGL